MRALLAAACLALVAGCSAPAAGPAPADPAEVVAPVAAPADGMDLGGSCAGPAGLAVRYPADWSAEPDGYTPGCTLFSADAFEVVPSSDVRTAGVRLDVEDLPFDQAAAAQPGDGARTEETVDGRRAVRIEAVAGPGLWPEGTPSTRWVVDLGDRVLMADAVGLPPFDHERDVEVLDAMVRALGLGTPA